MGDIATVCPISRKNINTNEKVKLFFLTKTNTNTNTNTKNFSPNMSHFHYKAPFLYIDAIYKGNNHYEIEDNAKNLISFEILEKTLLDRGFFKKTDENLDEGKILKEVFNRKKMTINDIVEIMHRNTITLLLDYNNFKLKRENINSSILKMKLALNNIEFCSLSLLVVKEKSFNTVSFIDNEEKEYLPEEFPLMIAEYEKSEIFKDLLLSYCSNSFDDSYKPIINIKEEIKNILSESSNKELKEMYFESENFKESLFVEYKIDLFINDPERYLLHNKFLHNLEKLDIVLEPSIYSFSSYNDFNLEKIRFNKLLLNIE